MSSQLLLMGNAEDNRAMTAALRGRCNAAEFKPCMCAIQQQAGSAESSPLWERSLTNHDAVIRPFWTLTGSMRGLTCGESGDAEVPGLQRARHVGCHRLLIRSLGPVRDVNLLELDVAVLQWRRDDDRVIRPRNHLFAATVLKCGGRQVLPDTCIRPILQCCQLGSQLRFVMASWRPCCNRAAHLLP